MPVLVIAVILMTLLPAAMIIGGLLQLSDELKNHAWHRVMWCVVWLVCWVVVEYLGITGTQFLFAHLK